MLTLEGEVEQVIDASEARIDGGGVLRGLVLGPDGDLFVRDNEGCSILDPDGHLMSRHHFGTSFTGTPHRAGNEWFLEWALEIEGFKAQSC